MKKLWVTSFKKVISSNQMQVYLNRKESKNGFAGPPHGTPGLIGPK